MESWSVGVRDFPPEFTADHGRGLGGVGRVKIEVLVPSRIFLLLVSTCLGDPVFGMPSMNV